MARKAAMCCHNRRQKLCVGGSKLKDVRSRIEKNTCQEVLHSQPLPKKKNKKRRKKRQQMCADEGSGYFEVVDCLMETCSDTLTFSKCLPLILFLKCQSF